MVKSSFIILSSVQIRLYKPLLFLLKGQALQLRHNEKREREACTPEAFLVSHLLLPEDRALCPFASISMHLV